MILERVLDFLHVQRAASLTEIAGAVGSSPEAVRSMLQTLQSRGLVHRVRLQSGCGTSCRQCAEGALEVYGHGAAPAESRVDVRCEGRKLQA